MNLNEYQQHVLRTTTPDQPFTGAVLNAALGLAGESGEVCDMWKKNLFQGHNIDYVEVGLELGDIMWYVAFMAHSLGFDLDTIAQMNVNKLLKRFPNGFTIEDSIRRVDAE